MSRPPEPKPARYDTPQTVIDDLLAALESAPEPPTWLSDPGTTLRGQTAITWLQKVWMPWLEVRAAALAKVKA